MNLYANAQGKPCTVDFSKDMVINNHAYGVQQCTIEFQCIEIAGVPGLVYVQFTPKGKRKPRSIAIHQDHINLL